MSVSFENKETNRGVLTFPISRPNQTRSGSCLQLSKENS